MTLIKAIYQALIERGYNPDWVQDSGTTALVLRGFYEVGFYMNDDILHGKILDRSFTMEIGMSETRDKFIFTYDQGWSHTTETFDPRDKAVCEAMFEVIKLAFGYEVQHVS